ncbi:hypothetical protein OC844_003233 [Tilletia horrida]|nr:hypothetical protein OC844_003233 [Tilletia horrida]
MSGHLSSLDLAVAWFNQFALRYAILGDAFTAVLAVSFVLMTLVSSTRVFKRVRFTWVAVATVAQTAASILNSIDARRLGLHENIPDSLFTAQVAMLFIVPLFADCALLPRIAELTRQKRVSALKDKRLIGALVLPVLCKIPRVLLVIDFLSMADTCVPLTKTSPLASVLMCLPAQKFALYQWVVTLVDQSINMIILAICMYHLGWGWGDKRAVSKSIWGKASMFACTVAAIMLLPVLVLTSLLALHASGQKTHIEGYLMALQPNVSVLGVALAALYPLVRADRRLQLARGRMQVSQTEARRLSMMEFEAADPFAGKGLPTKTLLGAPHLRPSGVPSLKRHSSHSGYLNSTTYSHFSVPSSGHGDAPDSPQDTYTIMNVKVVKPNRDLNVPNWTITTRQRSPHSESEDGLDEKIAPDAPSAYGGHHAPSTPTRGPGRPMSMNGGSPYTPSVHGTPMSQMDPHSNRGSPIYRS